MQYAQVQMNAAMAALQPDLAPRAAVELAPGLAQVLQDGFEESGGLVLLRRYADSADRVRGRDDATGTEAFINHVHVEDELPPMRRDELLAQTWSFAAALAAALKENYAPAKFAVIVAVADSYTVRFHKVRRGERWLADDIEGYKEAVLSLEVGGMG